jgi:hypothetical protein
MNERRQGMDEVNQRLTRLETIASSELGEPGKDGRLHRDITAVREVVDRIDATLSGSNGVGLGEKIRKLERNQAMIITGLGAALVAAARVAWEWARGRLGL